MAIQALNEMPEVLDAIFLPAIGKKNRPAGILRALCHLENQNMVRDAIFRHTHTLGIIVEKVERYILGRSATRIVLDGESIPAKEYGLENETYLRPEAEAIRALAKKRNVGSPAIRFRWKKQVNEK